MTFDLFDAHIHPEGLTDQDLDTLRFFGATAALVTAHHAIREPKAQSILQHFDDVVQVQLPRLEAAGIRGYAALGVDPRCLPRRGLSDIIGALPSYFGSGRVVAIGEIGLHRGVAAEEDAFLEQLAAAKKLKTKVLIHTPTREKLKITRRTLSILREAAFPPAMALVDHADPATARLIRACGHYAGLTVHPSELKPERAVTYIKKTGSERLVLNTDSGDGAGDLTALARTCSLLAKAGLSEALIHRVCFSNARDFLRVKMGAARRTRAATPHRREASKIKV